MGALPIPEAMLDGIAAEPDDAGAWQVLSDWMLEIDHPLATYVRCELELFRGVSSPDFLGAYAAERQALSRRVQELGEGLRWRCGLVVRAHVQPERFEAVAGAPELSTLHTLRLKLSEYVAQSAWAPSVRLVLDRVTPRLRTLSVETSASRLAPKTITDLLRACTQRPREGVSLRLSLGREAHRPVAEGLAALITSGWRRISLEGTHVPAMFAPRLLDGLADAPPDFRLGLEGTNVSPFELKHPALEWRAPDAPALWENADSRATIPVRYDGLLEAAWYPNALRQVSYAVSWMHWHRTELEDGTLVQVEGSPWRFRIREAARAAPGAE